MDRNLRSGLAELIGTFAVVFLGAGTVCIQALNVQPGQPQPGLVGMALAEGLALAMALTATVPVSGGYLNPAVTLALWVYKRLDGVRACWLAAAQVLGAALAGLLLRLLFDPEVLNFARVGTPHLNLPAFGGPVDGDPTLRILATGVSIEVVFTFLLTFAMFATMIDPRAPRLGGLGVGLTMVGIVLVGHSLTGGAANPARWFGPMVWEMTIRPRAWSDHAAYWLGPMVGALLAGGVYTALILPADGDAPAPSPTVPSTPSSPSSRNPRGPSHG